MYHVNVDLLDYLHILTSADEISKTVGVRKRVRVCDYARTWESITIQHGYLNIHLSQYMRGHGPQLFRLVWAIVTE
jgi:hypothetical protein